MTFENGGRTVTVEGGANSRHRDRLFRYARRVPALAVLGCKAKGKTSSTTSRPAA